MTRVGRLASEVRGRPRSVLSGAILLSFSIALSSCTVGPVRYPSEPDSGADDVPGTSQAPMSVAEAPSTAPIPAEWSFETVIGYAGNDDEVLLTFDDGPTPATLKILDILDRYDAKATFCMTGHQVDEEPEIAREVVARGHLVCSHSYGHMPETNRGGAAGIIDDIRKADEAFSRHLGIDTVPSYYRAPEGVFGGQVPQALAATQKRALGWSIDSSDWTQPGVPSIVDNVLSELGPGKVILMHDGGGESRRQTVRALPSILEGIESAGYSPSLPS